MSNCVRPMVAAMNAVAIPIMATASIARGACKNIGNDRAVIYTPAVTMVAAWMSAETGVGPAMASGSQTYSGIWVDLPQAPTSNRKQMSVGVPPDGSFALRC